MNIEHFHNQLALSLGYDRIINNGGLTINVDYSNPDDPWITINRLSGASKGFYASEDPIDLKEKLNTPEKSIVEIIEAAHYAYCESINDIFDVFHT